MLTKSVKMRKLPKITKKPSPYVDEMWRQYMETALWSSNDESDESGGEPMDRNYGVDDIDEDTQGAMLEDCENFYAFNFKDLKAWPADAAGHEFWLNRNGHGAGFWDSRHGDDESRN